MDYAINLRKSLDDKGHTNTMIVLPDGVISQVSTSKLAVVQVKLVLITTR
jgi:hypothetical protein